jgi:uncharacterized membrane protein
VIRTARLFESGGWHFSRCLGWFISPWVLFVTTAAVVIVTWRQQFASNLTMGLDQTKSWGVKERSSTFHSP